MSHAPILSSHLDDIQGMLTSGFGLLTASRFLLLTIADGREDQARAWLSQLAQSGRVVSAGSFVELKKKDALIGEAVAIAFSFCGLVKLGIMETDKHPFPSPFRGGMGSKLRECLLNDGPRSQWRWSDA